MNRFRRYLRKFSRQTHKYIFALLFVAALVLFALSCLEQDYSRKMARQVARVEKALHKREKIADHYAMVAMRAEQNWVGFDDMPQDMVLYRYNSDTLQSWVHQFPISNDETDVYPFSYRLQYLSNRNLYSTPLAYIGTKERYVNLGSAWYVVKTHLSEDRRIKVITGILINREYAMSEIPDQTNKKLNIGKGFSPVSLAGGAESVIHNREGEPLFSIVADAPDAFEYGNVHLRWIAFLLLLLAVFPYHYRTRTWKSFILAVTTLVAVRLSAWLIVAKGLETREIFSPMLYADSRLFDSLGSLLMNNAFVAMLVYAVFVMRKSILRRMSGSSRRHNVIVIAATIISGLLLMLYIHLVFSSLIANSDIELEIYRLGQMSIYSVLCYITFAMLFLALLYVAQMIFLFIRRDSRVNLFSWKYVLPYVLFISAYTVAIVSIYGFEREYELNRVRTNKLAIERDLTLEMYLRSVEQEIANDRFIAVLSSVKGGELIRSRLLERYLNNGLTSRYNVKISLCNPQDYLDVGGSSSNLVGCYQFYDDMLKDYGVRLAPNSYFFYLNNYNGLTSYLGVFTYMDPTYNTMSRLFFEIESKTKPDMISNPFDVLTSHGFRNTSIPSGYSYARYANGRLVTNGGDYNYPVSPVTNYEVGYMMGNKNGYVHFINHISDEDMTIISRPHHSVFPYVVSFSYLVIFYGLFILVFTIWGRQTKLLVLPRHSLRRKLSMLITLTMVGALLCMGTGSVLYVMRLNAARNNELMEEKISAVQNSLSKYCRYAMRYNAVNTPEMMAGMEEASNLLQTDVNLYDVHGGLIRTTNPEVFEHFIVGKRINNKAYENIIYNNSQRYVTVENIADINYYSIYAPLFNEAGDMVAIVNIPYFYNNEDVHTSSITTISTVVNIYLLLLIAAITLGAFLSNSFARPLAEIKSKIDHLALSGGNKHIKYKNTKDELGVLIESYNAMVDDLEESTKRLAQTERERAWTEMARQIAHEIKNPLTPMRLSIQYLMRLKEQGVEGWEDKLEKISKSLLEQIDILAETASEFSSFSKSFTEIVSEVDLDELLKEQLVIFDNRDGLHIRYVASCTGSIVEVRRSQLARVFVNLVTNSIQAIDNAGVVPGEIEIHLDRRIEDGRMFYSISFEDNGPGVSDDNRDKLFTPNFTTKTGGTGLGLAICRNIVQQSNGTISYRRSEKLGGACFEILLLAKEDLKDAALEVEMTS